MTEVAGRNRTTEQPPVAITSPVRADCADKWDARILVTTAACPAHRASGRRRTSAGTRRRRLDAGVAHRRLRVGEPILSSARHVPLSAESLYKMTLQTHQMPYGDRWVLSP